MAFGDRKPHWKQSALAIAPLLVATGMVVTIGLNANLADPTKLLETLANLGSNLLASGIGAYCTLRRPGKEYREALANHDLQELIGDAWGEAAVASLKAYAEKWRAQNTHSLAVTQVWPTPAFLKLLRELKREDFGRDYEISESTMREALEESRRAILPRGEEESAGRGSQLPNALEIQHRAAGAAEELKQALIDSVVSSVRRKAGGQPIPDDFVSFLNGGDEALKGGVLGQLCIYVAFYLKGRPNAQIAVVQLSLQEISDRQVDLALVGKRIEMLCIEIREAQSEAQRKMLDGFSARMTASLRREFGHFVRPVLEAPFATDPSWNARFSYRAQWTRFVGRKDAMEALHEFMRDLRPALWTVISGPAGSGKNRLAAELVSEFRIPAGEWYAGFLGSGSWLESDVAKWYPDSHTLIVVDYAVVDYANSLDDARLLALLKWVGQLPSNFPHRARVVLLDRLPPDSPFGIARRYAARDSEADIDPQRWYSTARRLDANEDSADSRKVARSRSEAFRNPLELHPVGQEDALEIVKDWAGTSWTTNAQDRVRQAIQQDGELARPLFASLLGDAIANDALPGELNPVTVASVALKRLLRGQDLLCQGQKERVAMLLAAATAGQGVAEKDLFTDNVLSGLIGDSNLSDEAVDHLADCLERVTGSSGQIPPLVPDFVGGLLVLEQLLSKSRFQRGLAKADHLAKFAWTFGHAPSEFMARLAADFVGREQQLADVAGCSAESVQQLLSRLLLSGLSADAMKRDGPAAVAWSVYVSSRVGQLGTAESLVDALESTRSTSPEEIDPEILARAWFGLGLSADLPPSARSMSARAMDKLSQLLERHDRPDIALWRAKALFNATVGETDAQRCEALAERIGEIRRQHDTPEIAFWQAQAFLNATVVETDAKRREALAQRIGEIRRQHDTAEIALPQAQVLYNVTVVETDGKRREALAERIGEIRGQHDTPEIALPQARALYNATVGETDGKRREALAQRIGEIRGQHDTPEIALQQAMALFNATVGETDAKRCEALAERVREIRRQHDTAEIALQQAQALSNATAVEMDAKGREALAERIGEIRGQHDTPEIALQQAQALFNATVGETDAKRCEALAERIGEIRREHDTPEIALPQARALFNANVGETDVKRREALAERIGEIRREHDTPEIALPQARALYNATVGETDANRCEALAERIGEIRGQHDTPEIALPQAWALYNATVGETDANRREALAERIGEIRGQHDTPEIALQQALALFNATVGETDAKRHEALAERIGEILGQHDTPEIALQQALALFNATVGETDAKRWEALAERIGEIRGQHDTPEIAFQQAKALFGAVIVEMDANRREALGNNILGPIDVLKISESDRIDAKAIINASASETAPERREALAYDFVTLLRRAMGNQQSP